ncbi:MAG: Rieske 2Fe-2S domain-containing protein [Proteobacteria bacterium]|nr:Rieske 2Fe-2S domain-containing protein [Pseudomonadota bacterium]
MARTPLPSWSRRDFCVACLGTAVGAAVVACSDDQRPIETGGLDGSNGGSDLVDAGSEPDATSAGTCAGTATDVGLPAAFVLDTPVYITSGRFFVVKDVNGYYAVTSLCTHEGAICKVSSGRFRCPRHGALFTFNGAIISGPVNRALVHFAMCTLPNGHLGVTASMQVPAATRLVV